MPPRIASTEELDDLLSAPTPGVIETLGRLDGDLLILGVGGKMGPTLARMAARASQRPASKRTRHRRRPVQQSASCRPGSKSTASSR